MHFSIQKPQVVSAFPSQIAWLCRHPDLDKFDVSSVSIFVTSGSTINPIYEREIFDKLPNLLVLNIVRND
jgi:4-coumarate--CoA ligase